MMHRFILYPVIKYENLILSYQNNKNDEIFIAFYLYNIFYFGHS